MKGSLTFPVSDISFDSYDPLDEEYAHEEDEDDFGTSPFASMPINPAIRSNRENPDSGPSNGIDRRPAEKRLQELFDKMPGQTTVLYGILNSCLEVIPVMKANEEIERLSQYHKSVYTPADLTALLEKAGGIQRTDADGLAYNEEETAEGRIVSIDGVEYLEPATPPKVYWKTTDAGYTFLTMHKPVQQLENLLDRDSAYISIYQRVLKCCSVEEGASHEDITSLVDGDPLVKQPLRTAPYFTNNLSRVDALEWKDAWFLTESGRQALDQLEKSHPIDLDAIRASLTN